MVDLEPFRFFTSTDLYLVIPRLQKHRNMTQLNLSNHPDITQGNLCRA